MKQHITKKQFNEITEDEDTYLARNEPLSIGQMIEFLEEFYAVRIDQWMDGSGAWRVGLDWFDEGNYVYVVEKSKLCDALWAAVKFVLRHNDPEPIDITVDELNEMAREYMKTNYCGDMLVTDVMADFAKHILDNERKTFRHDRRNPKDVS